MNESERLNELYSYQLLDTSPEEELDELAKLATLICNTPISLISLVEKDRQWFKSTHGLDIQETSREDSFCKHLLKDDVSLLEINDALKDSRFENNPLVLGYPYIRYYAGAPLRTSNGNVLGALCVIDNKPNKLSLNQKKALEILAKKASDYMSHRKAVLEQQQHIEFSASRLKLILDNAPGVIFQLRSKADFDLSFDFISKGIEKVHPGIKRQEIINDPLYFLNFIHKDDIQEFRDSIRNSVLTLTSHKFNFRVCTESGQIKWYKVRATPKKMDNDNVVWFGTLLNVSGIMEYETILEQITHDISHVLRKPLTTLMGLNNIIKKEDKIDESTLKEYTEMISIVIEELDVFTRKLDQFYQLKIADHQTRLN